MLPLLQQLLKLATHGHTLLSVGLPRCKRSTQAPIQKLCYTLRHLLSLLNLLIHQRNPAIKC